MQSYHLKLLNMCKFAHDRKTLIIIILQNIYKIHQFTQLLRSRLNFYL